MAADQGVERPRQRRQVEGAFEARRSEQVVGRRLRVHLGQEPHALLGEGEGRGALGLGAARDRCRARGSGCGRDPGSPLGRLDRPGRLDRLGRELSHPLGGGRRRLFRRGPRRGPGRPVVRARSGVEPGCDVALDPELAPRLHRRGGDAGHRRRREQALELHLDAQLLAQAAQELGGEERVAAQVEEAVVDADRLDPQELLPDGGDPLLHRIARRLVGGLELGPGVAATGAPDQRRVPAHPEVEPGVQVAGRHHQVAAGAAGQQPVERLAPLLGGHGELAHGGLDVDLDRLGRPLVPAGGEPAGARPGGPGLGGSIRGEGVDEGVGGRVGGEAQAAQDRGVGREQQAEVRAVAALFEVPDRLLQGIEGMGLGPELLLGRPADRHQGAVDRAPGQGAGQVQDAVDRAEARHRAVEERPHLAGGGGVDGGDLHLRPGGFELPHGGDLAADGVVRAALGEPGVPGVAAGQLGAPGEHQARLERPRQVTGDDPADRAQAAGDDVDAPGAESDGGRHGPIGRTVGSGRLDGSDGRALVAPGQAPAAPPGDDRVERPGRRRQELAGLGEQPGGGGVRVA